MLNYTKRKINTTWKLTSLVLFSLPDPKSHVNLIITLPLWCLSIFSTITSRSWNFCKNVSFEILIKICYFVAIGKSTWWPRTTVRSVVFSGPPLSTTRYNWNIVIPPQRSCRGVYWFHHVRPSVCRQILCRTITWVVFLRILKFYQLLTGEERRIPFFFWRFSLLPFQSYWTWYDGKYNFYFMS